MSKEIEVIEAVASAFRAIEKMIESYPNTPPNTTTCFKGLTNTQTKEICGELEDGA